MKLILLIRHAKSSWESAAMKDSERPLNARGIRDADTMAKRLSAKVPAIDAFISSPACRTKSTAETFMAAFDKHPRELIIEKGLYLAPASFFEQLIGETENAFNTVAFFAHNPGITDFANSLVHTLKTDNIPTCGIFAVKAATDSWASFSVAKKELVFYDYPKLLG